MLSAGQTLVNKKTKKLARLATRDDGPWAWDIGKKTKFIDEFGKKFADDISNYTHIEDEFDRPYSRQVAKGQFVDITAKKYLVSKKKLAGMRAESIKELIKNAEILEKIILGIMDNPPKKPRGANSKHEFNKDYRDENTNVSASYSYSDGDIRFSIGWNMDFYQSQYFDFVDWFVARRGADKPLISTKKFNNRFAGDIYLFKYANQLWVWNRMFEHEFKMAEFNSPNI